MQESPFKQLPAHIAMVAILIFVPSHIAVWVFMAFYLYGIFVRFQEYQEQQSLVHELEEEKKKPKNRAPWWEVLGLEPSASIEECTQVRKLLTKIYHPDAGKMPNENAMRRINLAVEERLKLVEDNGERH